MSRLGTKKHSYADILKGSTAQTQTKIQKNPTHENDVPVNSSTQQFVIFCEWSFSIFIFSELLAFKLLDGG
jgi:hypothetical protein